MAITSVLVLLTSLYASPLQDSLQREATQQLRRGQEKQSLQTWKTLLQSNPQHLDALWHTAFLSSVLGARSKEKGGSKTLFLEGKRYADETFRRWPNRPESYFVKATWLGLDLHNKGARDRISQSKELRRLLDETLKRDANHPGANYLLGCWHYGFSTLSPLERGTVNLLLGGVPPDASLERAEAAFRKSIANRPDEPIYYLDLARTLVAMDKPQEARRVVQSGLRVPARTEDHEKNLGDLRDLAKSLGRER